MEISSRPVHDERALFEEEDEIVIERANEAEKKTETSKQRLLSLAKLKPQFEGLRTTPSGHRIQEIKELMTVPVSRLPCNPYTELISCIHLGDCHG